MMLDAGAPACVVAGAGPAGLTIARLLALKGWRVVLAAGEAREVHRLELLAPAARQTIAALGLEPLLDDRSIARPCLGIRRPEERSEFEDFMMHPAGQGHVVDRGRFDGRLREAAVAAGVEILPLRVTGATPDGAALRVRDPAGRDDELTLPGIVVDATGRAAAVARRKGASLAYRERMVAELVEDAVDPGDGDAPCWLDYRGDASGWSYRIRGPAGTVQTWRMRRGGAMAPGAIRGVDASACTLSRAAGKDWIAVGDAAMSFNPIASQGLFNALSSALAAAGLLLSPDGLTDMTAEAWSGAVAATFLHSETGRAAMTGGAQLARAVAR
ncbi:MAG: hypothetical protein JWR80_8595 [Bradyrhizobium sp.]|nr:hypothetical protein [Bradyrhizobium sp.]